MQLVIKNKFRFIAGVVVVALVMSLCGIHVSASRTDYDLSTLNGSLQITEEGTYTLTGKLSGTVTVAPGTGNVTLILDGADINGSPSAGIAVLGGNSVTIHLEENSTNRIVGGGTTSVFDGAVFSTVDLTMNGAGTLYIASSAKNGICTENADLTMEEGVYVIGAAGYGLEAEGKKAGTINLNGGTLKVEASSPIDPASKTVYNGTTVVDLAQTETQTTVVTADTAATDTSDDDTASTETETEETETETEVETETETEESESTSGTETAGETENTESTATIETAENTADTEETEIAESGEETAEPENENSEEAGSTVEANETETSETAESTEKTADKDKSDKVKNDSTENGKAEGEKPDFPQRQDGEQSGGTVLPEQMQQPTENQPEAGIPVQNGQPGQNGQPVQTFGEGTQPENLQNVEYAETAGEIVTSTKENTASTLEADMDNITYLTISDENSQIKIESSGTYAVSGTCSDGNITVKKNTTGVVLILEDLDLTSTTGATVSVNKNAEVKIVIEGDVVLTDNENPEDEDSEDEEVADAFDGAALKAKDGSNVYVTGDGTLTINGNAKNGIKAGEDSSMVFDGVTVNITAANDGINSGYDLTLLSGDFTISAGDDAIHADHILTVGEQNSESGTGPVIRVTDSYEGMEGTVVNIFSGDISITAEDDAVNAANSDGTYEEELDYSINMTGGKLALNSGGDGLDSNGNINLIDGSAEISSASQGGEAGIDYDGAFYLSEDFNLQNSSGIAGADGEAGGQTPGQKVQPQGQNQQPSAIPDSGGQAQNSQNPVQENQPQGQNQQIESQTQPQGQNQQPQTQAQPQELSQQPPAIPDSGGQAQNSQNPVQENQPQAQPQSQTQPQTQAQPQEQSQPQPQAQSQNQPPQPPEMPAESGQPESTGQ